MKKVLLPLAALLLSTGSAYATANIYASALKAEGGKISFILNEDATALTFSIIKDGQVVASADLGTGVKGLNTFDIPAMDAPVAEYEWAITATAATVSEPVAFTDGTNVDLQTSSARGIAVDVNQTSPAFGNIYTVTASKALKEGARVACGLYAFTADLNAINQDPYTGGIEWAESQSSPNNVAVAENGQVFICSWGDCPQAGVWYANPVDLAGNWSNVFAEGDINGDGLLTINGTKIHGSVQDVALYGDGADRMMYTSDEDMKGTNGDIMVYAIGDLSKPWDTAPTHDWDHPEGYVNGNHRLASDGRGGLWMAQYRWQESAANACVYHYNANGELDFQTGDKSVFLGSTPTGAMNVNADNTLMCVAGSDSGLSFTIAAISWTDGIPALTKLYDVTFPEPYTGKRPFDVAFDAADNVYILHNADGAAGGVSGFALPKEKNEFTTKANSTLSTTSGIEATLVATPITYAGGVINASSVAKVYTPAGAMVAEGTTIDMNAMAGGVYIVRTSDAFLKIVK